jgi:hypothetical protein
VDHDGAIELVAYGLNDVDDYRRFGDPVLVVIDPRLITGACESSASRGFGLPVSAAERYYIAFPFPDAAITSSTRIMAYSVRRLPDGGLDVFVSGEVSPSERLADRKIGYDAIIDGAMRVVQIKPNDALIDLHRRLYEGGSLTEPLSDAYFQALAARTRYWNGTVWSTTVARVAHDGTVPSSH